MSEIDSLGPKPKIIPTAGATREQHRQAQQKADKKMRKKAPKKPPASDHQLDEYV